MPGLWLISLFLFCCYSLYESGSGYLGTYCVKIVGMSETAASTFAIIRNYVILAVSTFLVGFIADKLQSKIKTMCIYSVVCAAMLIGLVVFGHAGLALPIALSSIYAFSSLA